MLDRDESALHARAAVDRRPGLLDSRDIVLADIRDADAHRAGLRAAPPRGRLPRRRAQAPADAGAVPRRGLEDQRAGHAERAGVGRAAIGVRPFVNISTDKAADPISVLGQTKRIAERLTAWYAGETGSAYLSVRFGNVLGSRGSVLHTFPAQIDAGGPVTVTHPEVTRFFMTIPEACSSSSRRPRSASPARCWCSTWASRCEIVDVARRLIERAGRDIEIVFTGLRPGEKLHEVLWSVRTRWV